MIASYGLRLVCLSLAVFLLVHTAMGAAVALIAFGLVAQGVAAGVFVWMGRKRMLDA